MQIIQTRIFEKAVKRLHANQKQDLDQAIQQIIADPSIGIAKKGDLAGIQVYKFAMKTQQILLAYHYEHDVITLTLLAFGSHENFYKSLKK